MRRLHLALLLAAVGGASSCRSLGKPAPAPDPPRVWEWHVAPTPANVDAAALVALFADPNPDVRARAAWRLPAANPGTAELDALEHLLDDVDAGVRDHVSLALFRAKHPMFTPLSTPPAYAPPRILKKVRPEYPTEAAMRRAEGSVVVEILVSATGRVIRAQIEGSVPGLDDAALLNVRRWEFGPAMSNGRAVPCIVYGEVKFKLL